MSSKRTFEPKWQRYRQRRWSMWWKMPKKRARFYLTNNYWELSELFNISIDQIEMALPVYLFTQEQMKVICAMGKHKKFFISNFNFFRSFHWKVYGTIEFINQFFYNFSPIQKSMTSDYNENFYSHSIWISPIF